MQHPITRARSRFARLDVVATDGAARIVALLGRGHGAGEEGITASDSLLRHVGYVAMSKFARRLTELVHERPASAAIAEVEAVVYRNRSLDVADQRHELLLGNVRLHRHAAEA